MNTTLRRRLDALETKLGTGEEIVELFGFRTTKSRMKALLRQAAGRSIGVATTKSRELMHLQSPDPGRKQDG